MVIYLGYLILNKYIILKKIRILKGNLYFFYNIIYRKITRKDNMQKIKFYLEKYKIIIIIGILLLFILIGTICFISNNKEEKSVKMSIKQEKNLTEEKKYEKIKVDIKGMVKKPGVYELLKGDRVIDVINKAEGLVEGANTSYINLSKKVTDEMIIIRYSNDEVDKFKEEKDNVVYIKYECECIDNINDACINEKDTVNTNGVEKKKANTKDEKTDGLVSINTATKEELMTLSGVGESKAEAIISYREENGLFEKLEDIMNVSGIGQAAYSKIKDNIKL